MSEKIPKETFEEILERRPTNRVFFTCMVAQKKGKLTKETNKKNLIKISMLPCSGIRLCFHQSVSS